MPTQNKLNSIELLLTSLEVCDFLAYMYVKSVLFVSFF